MLLASVLAEGVSTLKNCAMEPEIVALADYLNSQGAKIKGAGSPTIIIKGVKELNAEVKELKEKIIDSISKVPGLISLSNFDITKKGKKLKEEKSLDGISCIETSTGVIVKVFVIVSINARVKTVSSEISNAIEAIFKKEKTKISQILIYVRGVE